MYCRWENTNKKRGQVGAYGADNSKCMVTRSGVWERQILPLPMNGLSHHCARCHPPLVSGVAKLKDLRRLRGKLQERAVREAERTCAHACQRNQPRTDNTKTTPHHPPLRQAGIQLLLEVLRTQASQLHAVDLKQAKSIATTQQHTNRSHRSVRS